MKVFITGVESFIGDYLYNILKKNSSYRISGIDLIKKKKITKKIDILDKNLYKKIPYQCDSIIHLAAISSANDFKKNLLNSYKINLLGIINLINAASAKKAKQIIFASSEWVYGEKKNGKITKESEKVNVTKLSSEYALSKYLGEQLLIYYCNKYKIHLTVLRFGIVYGPRKNKKNWSAIESITSNLIKNGSAKVGSFRTARRFIFIDDLCRALKVVIGKKGFHLFNVTGDKLISLRDIVIQNNLAFNKNYKYEQISSSNFNIRNVSNTKIKKKFKWSPKVNLLNGIRKISKNIY